MKVRTKRKLENVVLICMVIIAFTYSFIMAIDFSDDTKTLGNETQNETELTESGTQERTPQLTISPIKAPKVKVKAAAPTIIKTNPYIKQELKQEIPEQPKIPTPPDIEIPFDDNMKSFIYEKCRYNDDMYCFVMAIIKQESSFNLDAVSADGLDWGLMQLRIYYHKALAEQFNVSDPKNPYDNITIGVGLLWENIEKYEYKNLVLMCHRFGEPEAKKKWENGIYSTEYTVKVLGYYEEYLKEME